MFLENQPVDERISRAINNDHTAAMKSDGRKQKGASVCVLCQKRFKSSSFYRRHLRLHHEGGRGRPFLCSLCPKAFSIKSSLQRHMNCHTGEKPFVCSICQRGYTRRSVLSLHVQQVHECRKPFQCDACGLRFSQKGNLQAHFRRKHLPPATRRIKAAPPVRLPPAREEPWAEEEEPLPELDALLELQLEEEGLLPPWTLPLFEEDVSGLLPR